MVDNEKAVCYHYKTGTEMDMATETSPTKLESRFVAELPANAYPAPNPPKCKA